MGRVFVIRHGERYPLIKLKRHQNIPESKYRQLTENGRAQLRELGRTLKPNITKALHTDEERCRDSLEEFLIGANSSVELQSVNDQTRQRIMQLIDDKEFNEWFEELFAKEFRHPELLDHILEDEDKSHLEGAVRRFCNAAFLYDAIMLAENIPEKSRTDKSIEGGMDCLRLFAALMQPESKKAFNNAILSGLEAEGDTILLASDFHIWSILEILAPTWLTNRPKYAEYIILGRSESGVQLNYRDQQTVVENEIVQSKLAI